MGVEQADGCGMTDEDWRRLHDRIIPNPLSLEEFKLCLLEGRLPDTYLAKDLRKIMQELRDLLKEHGELREAANMPLTGRKAELGQAAVSAVRLIDQGDRGRSRSPALQRRAGGGVSPAAENDSGADERGRLSSAPDLGNSPDNDNGLRAPNPSLHTTPGRAPPMTDHIIDSGFDPLATSTVPQRTVSGQEVSPKVKPSYSRTWQPSPEVARTVVMNASVERPASSATAATAAAIAERVQCIASVSSTLLPVAAASAASKGAKNELMTLNDHSPPFSHIVSIARRFQLRYGTHPLKFEVPIQYAQAVATRRLRVHLIPLRHPNVPSRWPVAKDIVVYVNNQCVTTPWRRSWPERKQEVAKTYLPLDVTQLVIKSQESQKLQIDVFNKDYLTPAIIAVVQPYTLEEVVETLLERTLGDTERPKIEAALLNGATGRQKLNLNDAAVARFYQRVMEDDTDDGLEVDDPIISTKCPISQMPIEIPVRGQHCDHLQCVDLQSHLVSCHKGAYWNCALCDRELRPTTITVDTILWRYLLGAAAGGAATSQHLRLSTRNGAPPGEGIDAAAKLSKYYWHPSRGLSGEANYLVDDDGENNSGGAGQNASGDDASSLDEQAQAKQEHMMLSEQQQQLNARLTDPVPGSMPSNYKRPREEGHASVLLEGTLDNPIEL